MSKMTIRFDVHPGITVEEIADKLHRAIDAFGVSVEVDRLDAYNPDQPRDEQGRFGEGGAAAGKLPGGAGAPQGRRVASRTAEAKQREEASKGAASKLAVASEARVAARMSAAEQNVSDDWDASDAEVRAGVSGAEAAREAGEGKAYAEAWDRKVAAERAAKAAPAKGPAPGSPIDTAREQERARAEEQGRGDRPTAGEGAADDSDGADMRAMYAEEDEADGPWMDIGSMRAEKEREVAIREGGAKGAKAEADRLAEREAGRPATRAEARAGKAAKPPVMQAVADRKAATAAMHERLATEAASASRSILDGASYAVSELRASNAGAIKIGAVVKLPTGGRGGGPQPHGVVVSKSGNDAKLRAATTAEIRSYQADQRRRTPR
jgi:hypothetical protein